MYSVDWYDFYIHFILSSEENQKIDLKIAYSNLEQSNYMQILVFLLEHLLYKHDNNDNCNLSFPYFSLCTASENVTRGFRKNEEKMKNYFKIFFKLHRSQRKNKCEQDDSYSIL